MPNLISPEIIRLAQIKARQAGVNIQQELARSIVEDAIIELDPELDLVVNTSESWSEIVGFGKSVGANDVVVNDRHIDVRVLSEDGTVEISRALIGTSYLADGSLIVSMQSTERGAVIGFVSSANWSSAEQQSKDEFVTTIKFARAADFDLGKALSEICHGEQVSLSTSVKTLPNQVELLNFIYDRKNIIAARQKQIVLSILNDLNVRSKFEELQSKALPTQRIASDASIWNQRIESVVDQIAPTFNALNQNDIRKVVRKTGEIFGGQPDSPQFRKHMINTLTVEQLSKKFAGASASKLAEIVDNVFSGKSAVDAVKGTLNNKVAVEIAAKIKSQRKRAEGFFAATADEIGAAFGQLSLQPSYATHSSADSGVDSINEALQLLEAAELAEQARRLAND